MACVRLLEGVGVATGHFYTPIFAPFGAQCVGENIIDAVPEREPEEFFEEESLYGVESVQYLSFAHLVE